MDASIVGTESQFWGNSRPLRPTFRCKPAVVRADTEIRSRVYDANLVGPSRLILKVQGKQRRKRQRKDGKDGMWPWRPVGSRKPRSVGVTAGSETVAELSSLSDRITYLTRHL